jgi:RNA polymerase sigma-70 factor (ECF subfamily)
MKERPSAAASDDDLVAEARHGSEPAMEELYRRHRSRVLDYVLRTTGDPDLAEEVLSATFTRFLENLARYRPQGRLAGYWLRIARSRLVAEQMARHRLRAFPPHSPRAPDAALVAGTPSPDHLACERELQAQALHALATLPERLRTVVVLHLYEGLDYAAVGEIVGAGESTARSRMRYALQALRRMLLPACQTSPEPAGSSDKSRS